MQSHDRLPNPNLFLIVGMAAGLWTLIGLSVAGLWPQHPASQPASDRGSAKPVTIAGESERQAQPRKRAVRVAAKPKRKRRWPSLAARAFPAVHY